METATKQVKKVLSLKEQLMQRADLRVKTVELKQFGLTVEIRRATVGERKEIMAKYQTDEQLGIKDSMAMGSEIIKRLLVPPLTEEEFTDLPSVVADAISTELMVFNGWTTKGAAELVDQFSVKP
jgi:hypothetical protein